MKILGTYLVLEGILPLWNGSRAARGKSLRMASQQLRPRTMRPNWSCPACAPPVLRCAPTL